MDGTRCSWERKFKAEITSVILLVNLPVAIQKEGVLLCDLHIRCFPTQYYNRRLVDPAGSKHQLRTACQHLKHVTVGAIGYLYAFERDPSFFSFSLDSGLATASLIRYLCAILSGPQLKTSRLHPEVFAGEKGDIRKKSLRNLVGSEMHV